MSSNVQSVVCCLGDPVAGNPTQFLMQRAAAAQSLDWMFVTAEVPECRIKEAFQGIRALRFSGVAFLPPHQTAGAKLVDSVTEAALRSGHVRIARRDGDLWLGDDSLGTAIVELVDFHSDSGAIQNERRGEQGLFVVTGLPWLAQLVRLSLTSERSGQMRELVESADAIAEPKAELPSDELQATPTLIQSPNIDSNATVKPLTFDDAAKSDGIIDTLVVDSAAECPSAKILAKFKWSETPTIVFVEPNPRWEHGLDSIGIPNAKILRPLDVAGAKAIVNFNFWTGYKTDFAFVRESLDEYCQW
ncbi:MAG: hypothetical protein SGI77_21950 [Pirellulaceae bacterium]|nr:hypothetical protein [Pirellulaceae bacterium]